MNVPSSGETREDSKTVLVKGIIEDFIKRSTQSSISKEEIKKSLFSVYGTELLLSKEVYGWALEKVASTPSVAVKSSPDSPEEDKEIEKPLFCEDTVYHASLCCVAVSTKDATNYKKFFDRDYPNHQFEEASLSISRDKENVDRYLIAKKGKTYFIAFQSEPKFSQWPQLFLSFEHGECTKVSYLTYEVTSEGHFREWSHQFLHGQVYKTGFYCEQSEPLGLCTSCRLNLVRPE